MKLLSAFFLLHPEEILDFEPSIWPALSHPTILGREVDPTRLLCLEYIIAGWYEPVEAAETIAGLNLPEVEQRPMVMDVSPEATESIAGASAAQLAEWAAQWASSIGWRSTWCSPGDLDDLLIGLRRLARQALSTQSGLFMWYCNSA